MGSSFTVASSTPIKKGDRITLTTAEGTFVRRVSAVSGVTVTVLEPGFWAWLRRRWRAVKAWFKGGA